MSRLTPLVRASRAAASSANPNKPFLIPARDDLAIIGKKEKKNLQSMDSIFVFISGKNKAYKFYLN